LKDYLLGRLLNLQNLKEQTADPCNAKSKIHPGAVEALVQEGYGAAIFLHRHVTDDWGDLEAHDRRESDLAVGRHLQIFSVYIRPPDPGEIWIITKADRKATSRLLPSEY
jgi:hypothetical protein